MSLQASDIQNVQYIFQAILTARSLVGYKLTVLSTEFKLYHIVRIITYHARWSLLVKWLKRSSKLMCSTVLNHFAAQQLPKMSCNSQDPSRAFIQETTCGNDNWKQRGVTWRGEVLKAGVWVWERGAPLPIRLWLWGHIASCLSGEWAQS